MEKKSNHIVIDPADIALIVREIGREARHVIPILQAIQRKYNYLPVDALRQVCELTDITPAAISGVSTFYSQFRFQPAGRHRIKLCVGTACHVMGADTIYDAFKQELDIPEHEDTDKDHLFTIEKVACLGCCMLAPAVQIDHITYGHLTSNRVSNILADFLSSQNGLGNHDKAISPFRKSETSGVVRMCRCASCDASGAHKVYAEIRRQIDQHHLAVTLKNVGCSGIAYQAPLLEISTHNGRDFQYGQVTPAQIPGILLRHFRPKSLSGKGRVAVYDLLDRLLTGRVWEPPTHAAIDTRFGADAAYIAPQKQIVTEHSGQLDPLDIDEYCARGGFAALDECLKNRSSQQIIETVEESGLRGRGGGGFPTGKKWRMVAEAADPVKYIVCNGDEGDPGAFMDRMILESFPFRVIEGMLIAALALRAKSGFLYIRAEYPLAIQRISDALAICKARGYLGQNRLQSGHDFDLQIASAAGAFVCGEETALLASIQGERGMPRLRPPYPVEAGLWGKPTLVNNVETFASLPWIIRNGAAAFAVLGTSGSKGTKTFALAGKVARSGLVEVPMGLTLRQIVEEIGGGVRGGKKLKAIQIGGPSGGCVPAELADTPVDFEALKAAGAIMGSGGMVVLDETDCMVDIARYFMSFTQAESCGKCTFCRIGTKRMLEILDRLCAGQGQEGDLEKLEQLSQSVAAGSLCGLGKTAPNPVLTTLKYFRSEYQAHIEGRCPTGKCRDMIVYSITDACIGCTKCAQACPVGAIAARAYEKHQIDVQVCTKCDRCRQVCPVAAVEVG